MCVCVCVDVCVWMCVCVRVCVRVCVCVLTGLVLASEASSTLVFTPLNIKYIECWAENKRTTAIHKHTVVYLPWTTLLSMTKFPARL